MSKTIWFKVHVRSPDVTDEQLVRGMLRLYEAAGITKVEWEILEEPEQSNNYPISNVNVMRVQNKDRKKKR